MCSINYTNWRHVNFVGFVNKLCNTRKLICWQDYTVSTFQRCVLGSLRKCYVCLVSVFTAVWGTPFPTLWEGVKFTRDTVLILCFRYFWIRISLCHLLWRQDFWTPLFYVHFDLILFKGLMLLFLLEYLCSDWRCRVFHSTCDMADEMRVSASPSLVTAGSSIAHCVSASGAGIGPACAASTRFFTHCTNVAISLFVICDWFRVLFGQLWTMWSVSTHAQHDCYPSEDIKFVCPTFRCSGIS